MDRASERSSANVARLRNTCRVEVLRDAADSVKDRFTRSFFSVKILRELFQLTAATVMAVQDTGDPLAYEITFQDISAYRKFAEDWRLKTDNELLKSLKMTPLCQRGYLPVVVRLYNAFIPDADVQLYLERHAEAVRGGTWLYDEGGFWTVKRRYAVKLKEDPRHPGSVIHLPGPWDHFLPWATCLLSTLWWSGAFQKHLQRWGVPLLPQQGPRFGTVQRAEEMYSVWRRGSSLPRLPGEELVKSVVWCG